MGVTPNRVVPLDGPHPIAGGRHSACSIVARMGTGYSLGRLRHPSFDGLRGVAVVLVLLGHLQVPLFLGGGDAGVTLFFVLSGFLITRLLVEEHQRAGRIDVAAFYLRRARRLLPALTALLVAYLVLALATGLPLTPVLFVVTYTANVASLFGVDMGYLVHTWSLALEEQFYLLWPFLVIPVSRWRFGRLALAGAALASMAVRVAVASASVQDHNQNWLRPDVRADAIIIGCLLALSMDALSRSRWLGRASDWAVVVLVCTVPFAMLANAVTLSAMAVAGAAVIARVALDPSSRPARVLAWSPLRWTGQISYGVYLWHFLFIGYFHQLGRLPNAAEGLAVTAASFGLAAASWYLIERPVAARQVKRRTAPEGAGQPQDKGVTDPLVCGQGRARRY